MTCFGTADVMDLEKPDISDDRKGSPSASCSICLEVVLDQGERSVAKLQCGHVFHLDCIGSAFNVKGAMQCPNCRKVEKGHWLYAHGHHSSTDFDIDGWIADDIYDLNYSELPLAYQWCPFSVTQLDSLFEDIESNPNAYETLGSSPFVNTSISSGNTHVPEASHFRLHSITLAQPPPLEIPNPHSFSSSDRPNHNWHQQQQQQHQTTQLSVPLPSNSDHHYGPRLSRADTSNHPQRPGSFVHPRPRPRPIPHGSVHPRSGSNLVAGSMALPVPGDVRGHASHSSTFVPVRRPRPRGLVPISTSTSTDTSGFYGNTRNLQDPGRQFDRVYGWGRDNFTPLPWIPVDGESRWWGPFNPNQAPSGNFHQRGRTTTTNNNNERVSQNRSDNGYHHGAPPSFRMPPPPYM